MHAFPRSVGLSMLFVALPGLLVPTVLSAREEVPDDLEATDFTTPDVDFEALEPALEPRLRAALEEIEGMLAEDPVPGDELAGAYGVLGQMLVAVGQYGPARTSFREATELVPGNYRWHHYLGLAAQADGDLEAAVAAYRAALAENPDFVPAMVRAGETLVERGFLDAARQIFGRALETSPDDPGALRGAGRVALEQGRAGEAIERLEKALELSPFADSLHGLLARAHAATGNEERELFHRARAGEEEMIPADPLALEISGLSQGLTFEVVQRRARAEDFSERAFLVYVRTRLAPIPSAPEGLERMVASLADRSSPAARGRLLWARAEILAARGEWSGVEEAASAALELAPELASPHYLRAEALRRSGEATRARAALEKALEADPAHRRAREALVGMLAAVGETEDALEHARTLRDHYPDDVEVALRIAELLSASGRTEEGRSFLEGVVEESEGPARARALVALAGAELRRGDAVAAEDAYRRARAADEDRVPAILGEAGLLARRGELDEAAAAYREAIERQPLDERSRQLEAGALILGGRHGEAVERLEEGIAVLPESLLLKTLLARHLAASPDPKARDGERAVELASAVREADPSPVATETLAMALAEAGRFEEAIQWQERLIRETAAGGERARLEANLERYRRDLACCAS